MARILVLGAGYVGAALGARALDEGHEVTLADNWYATERAQLDGLEARGARVETADIRSSEPDASGRKSRAFDDRNRNSRGRTPTIV